MTKKSLETMRRLIQVSLILIVLFLMWSICSIVYSVIDEKEVLEKSLEVTYNVEEVSPSLTPYPNPVVVDVITPTPIPTLINRGNYTKRSIPVFVHFEMNLLIPSGLTIKDIDAVLRDTPLEGLSETYIKAEEETGVNALFLVALSIHESAWGNSKLARERNNIYGFHAYDYDPNKAKYFDSKEECIMHVANHLKTKYLTEDGEYFNGYTVSAINVKYATDKEWDEKVFKLMKYIYNKVVNSNDVSSQECY